MTITANSLHADLSHTNLSPASSFHAGLSTSASTASSALSVPVAAATCGALVGLGVWLLVATLTGHDVLPARLTGLTRRGPGASGPHELTDDGLRSWLPTGRMRIAAVIGLIAGVAAAVALELPVLALLAVGAVAIAVEASRVPSVAALNAQGAGVAAWCESVRQELDAGQPMLAALVAACDMPPQGMGEPLARLGRGLREDPVPQALWAFAADVRHPAAGQAVAALEVAYRHGAGDLPRLMARQVETTRHHVQVLRERHAARARHRRSMLLLLGLFLTVIAALFLIWPDFLIAYHGLNGQLVLAVIGAAVLLSVRALIRLSAPALPPDFFPHAPETTTTGAAIGADPGDITRAGATSAAPWPAVDTLTGRQQW